MRLWARVRVGHSWHQPLPSRTRTVLWGWGKIIPLVFQSSTGFSLCLDHYPLAGTTAQTSPPHHPTLLACSFLYTAVSTSPESLNQSHPTEDSLLSKGKMEDYETNVLPCWYYYKDCMDSVKDWCNWTLISRYYSNLQYCLEDQADQFGLGFPNPLAEKFIFETHQIHFANCSLVQPTFSDPPEGVLLAMIIVPISLIPFLVTLVVWRSKDGDTQA